jgi:hypothetical protein
VEGSIKEKDDMKSILLATTIALGLSAGTASADGGGGAIANYTTTSMGAPAESPNYSAPRSAVIPGLPAQARQAQALNRGHQRQRQVMVGEINLAPRHFVPVDDD